jgi:hypothetical protein
MDRITSYRQSVKRFKSLRIIGALFTLSGAVLLAIGGLLFVYGLYNLQAGTTGEPPPGTGFFAARQVGGVSLGTILGGTVPLIWSFAFLVSGLHHLALGGVLRLLIHLEENMRAFAHSLDQTRMRIESRGEGVEPVFRS